MRKKKIKFTVTMISGLCQLLIWSAWGMRVSVQFDKEHTILGHTLHTAKLKGHQVMTGGLFTCYWGREINTCSTAVPFKVKLSQNRFQSLLVSTIRCYSLYPFNNLHEKSQNAWKVTRISRHFMFDMHSFLAFGCYIFKYITLHAFWSCVLVKDSATVFHILLNCAVFYMWFFSFFCIFISKWTTEIS